MLAGHFRVHVVDLPGYGASAPLPAAQPDDIAAIADAVMAALPEKVTLCGWSLGGHIAVAALARHARRVEKLVLCGTTPCFVKAESWPHGVAPELLSTFETMLGLSPKNVVSRFAAMINQGDHAMRDVARQAAEVARGPLPDKTALTGGLSILRRFDWRPLAPRISHPVLIVHGDADPLMPRAGAEALRDLFPAAQLDVFEGGAHTPFLSRPERFVEALRHFA
jgi:pimeloyl-[acyl-carrier protein] methyl ester esterase